MKKPWNRGGLRFYLVTLSLAAGYSTDFSVILGWPCIALGVCIHFWAKGCLQQNETVTRSGPYQYVRHPFYLANALIDTGIVVMSGWWVLQLVLPLWWLGIYIPTMREEERHLSRLYPETYTRYQYRVPMIIPYRRPLAKSKTGFSWQNPNIATGREIPRAIRLLSYPLLFFVAGEVRDEGLLFLNHHHGMDFLMLVILVTLYTLSLIFEWHVKYRRVILPTWATTLEIRLLFAALLLAMGANLTFLETEHHMLIVPMGVAFLLCSLWAHFNFRQMAALVSECLLLVALVVLYELIWLAAFPVAFYASLLLDHRLSFKPCPRAGVDRFFIAVRAESIVYFVMMAFGIIAAVGKETVIG